MVNPLALQIGEQVITQASTWRTYNVTIGTVHTLLTTTDMPGRFGIIVSNPTLTASVYIGPETLPGTLDGPGAGLWIQPQNNYNRIQLPAGDGLAIYGISLGGDSYVTIVEMSRTPTQ